MRSDEATLETYPECASYLNGSDPLQQAVVHANFGGHPTEIGAALDMCFGMALWVAFIMHAVGVEVYVRYDTQQYCLEQMTDDLTVTTHTEGGGTPKKC